MSLSNVTSGFIRRSGSEVSVFELGNIDGDPVLTERALKNSKKGTGQVVFQFIDPQDIEVGQIIIQSGARDHWKVIDVEDVLVQGSFSYFAAYVEKLGKNIPKAESHSIQNITYNVSGANARVNNHSTDNSSNINNSNCDIESLIIQLRDEIKSQEAEASIIEEALGVVDVIEAQSKKDKPNKTVLRSMLSGISTLLPHAGSLASIGSMILAATSG